MTDEFKNVPVEEGTKIISRNLVRVSGFLTCHEIWCWEGITAESVIFRERDVAHLSDEDIKCLVLSNMEVVDPVGMTFKRNGDFIFCNFNFLEPDD